MNMTKRDFTKIGESLYTTKLSNGLTVNVLRKPGYRLSYAVFGTNYGGAHRRFKLGGQWHDTPAGVAHFLEHKMFDMPDGDNALSVLSANGAQPNAFTGSGMTCYYFDCTQGFEENLRMLLSFVSTPYFTAESVDKEQGIIGQEIGMVEDSPGYVVYNRLMRLLYEHNPVRDQVAGSVESIAEINADMLYNCHRAFYAPSNMVLCAAGDIDPDTVVRIAEEILPAQLCEIPEVDLGKPETLIPLDVFHSESMEVSAPQFIIGAKVKPAPNGEALLRQKIVSQLALRVLFGSSSSFYTGLYEQGILNRDYDYENDYTAGTATIMISGESPDPQRVLGEVKACVNGVRESGIDPAAFERSKKASFGARLRGLEDFDSECVSFVSGCFSGYCPLDSFEVLESVTREECESFILEFMGEDRLAMSVVVPLK